LISFHGHGGDGSVLDREGIGICFPARGGALGRPEDPPRAESPPAGGGRCLRSERQGPPGREAAAPGYSPSSGAPWTSRG
jgi:hypothetical protein